MKTKPLNKGDKVNFATLQRAIKMSDAALVSAIRKSDRKNVALVCAMNRDGENIHPVPLAVMIEGNPFEDFEDLTADPQEREAVYIVFTCRDTYVRFNTSDGRTGSTPILENELPGMTMGRILQSLGCVEPGTFTFEVLK